MAEISRRLSECMDEESGAQLGLKPGALRGHDLAGVGDRHELLDRDWIKGECGPPRSVDPPGQLPRSANPPDKIDPFARAGILDSEDRRQELFLEQADVETRDRVG